MKEIWKTIPECEHYQVSNLGRIRSLNHVLRMRDAHGGYMDKRFYGKIVNPSDNGNGYKYIAFSDGEKRKHLYIHRLVAAAFCPNPNGYTYVNHIDYNRGNNVATNLEWCTHKQNMMHSAKRLCHPHNVSPGMTGEKYITYREKAKEKKYRVRIAGTKEMRFATLTEAVAYRNEVMRCDWR